MNKHPSFTFMNITDALFTVYLLADETVYPFLINEYVKINK